MRPVRNQAARLHGKTHKFYNISDITTEKLKFRRIIDQTGFYTYNAA